jgi:thiopurine S-methyltransferase
MDHDFWLQRWRDGQTGFHNDRVMPLLEQHWDALALPADSRVFVPLAGKSLDMLWLAARGHHVLGVELSPLAVAQFLAENHLHVRTHDSRHGRHHVAGNVELICGDVFALDARILADCAGIYDRAALIALPVNTRRAYVDGVYAKLPIDCRGLLITLEYPQHEKIGPPFSVGEDEVHRLFAGHWTVDMLERRDILSTQPRFVAEGVSALSTAVYRLRHDRS